MSNTSANKVDVKSLLVTVQSPKVDLLQSSKVDSQSSKVDSQAIKRQPFWVSWRMAITCLMFFGVTLHSVMRSILAITMVCMVNSTAVSMLTNGDSSNGSSISNDTLDYPSTCSVPSSLKAEYDGEYIWTVEEQSYIFLSMAIGQVITCLPAGLYVDRFSAHKLLTLVMLMAAALTFLTPVAASFGSTPMIVVRTMLGLTGGTLWPCVNAIIARWAPASERGTLYALVTAGNQISIVFMMPISAAFCRLRHLLKGWPINYYLTGLLSVLWTLIWYFLGSDYPSEHKKILKDELAYINAGHPTSVTTRFDHQKFKQMPICMILFSPASLSIVACLTSAAWGILILLNYLPTYLKDVLLVDLSTNGEFSSLPFLAQFVFKIIFSHLGDRLKSSSKCNKNFIVKSFNTLGMFSLAGFLFGATFVNCTQSTLAVVLLCTGAALYSAVTPGFLASMVLIAPRYAGLLAAWTNFVANVSGILLPFLIGRIVRKGEANEWKIVIGVGSAAQVLSALVFIMWGSGEEQAWAKPVKRAEEETKLAPPVVPKLVVEIEKPPVAPVKVPAAPEELEPLEEMTAKELLSAKDLLDDEEIDDLSRTVSMEVLPNRFA